MAGNIVIRFTGDAQGMQQFFASTSRQVDEFAKRTSRAYGQHFGNLLGTNLHQSTVIDRNGVASVREYGSLISKVRQEYDQIQNSIKTTATSAFKTLNGDIIPVAETTRWLGDMKLITTEMERQVLLQTEIEALQRSAGQQGRALQSTYDTDRDALYQARRTARTPLIQSLATARDRRETLTEAIRDRRAYANGQGYTGAVRQQFDAVTNTLVQERNALLGQELNLRRAITREENNFNTALGARNAQLAADRAALASQTTPPISSRIQARNASIAEEARLRVAPPTVPPEYQRLTTQYPQLAKQLQKAGLTQGAGPLGDILRNQRNASFDAPVRDLVTNVTRLSGAFTDSKGVLTQWRAEVDANGKVVTRFGGNLSGLSRVTEQISRNFQKVIEWTVATTLVFGGLAAAAQGLEIIKTLDADLTRFAVTSQFTKEQTSQFYDELFRISQVTATPLEQLVKASDDFALAISKPGQTVEELTKGIGNLAEAVGIYTNLTGDDSVEATDLLVSTMKQLGLTTEEVFVILNKVTAAAGGQSGAISDITKGLSVMAEAGEQANLTVDQQIGVIKTLSQVTSKSPAEVATAFKNLVGALENPAALKALKGYNIGLISEGNSIIDIYTQIADKISTGQIAPDDVSGLLRAISGGPRRSPDAAALLANINQVLRETEVSSRATNEAFLANAQVLTTLNAKMIQFNNTVKDRAFRELGEALKALATTGLEFLTKLLDAFGNIPSEFFVLGAQLLAFATAFSVLSRLGGVVAAAFASMKASVIGFGSGVTSANAQLTLFNSTLTRTEQLKASFAAGGRGRAIAGAGLVGGIVGGAAGLATGQTPGQIVGSVAQGAGLGLLTVPSPDPFTKLGGAALFAAGAVAQLVFAQKESSDVTDEQKAAILTLHQSTSNLADSIHGLEEDQKALSVQIEKYNGMSKLTLEDEAQLSELQEQRTNKLLDLAEAHRELNTALAELQDLMPQFKSQLGDINFKASEELNNAIDRYMEDVLNVQYPDQTTGGKVPLPSLIDIGEGRRPRAGIIPTDSSSFGGQYTVAPGNGTTAGVQPRTVDVDLRSLNDEGVRGLISELEKGNVTFELTTQNLDLIRAALNRVGGWNSDEYKQKSNVIIDEIERQKSAIKQVTDLFTLYDSTIAALQEVNPNVSAELAKQSKLIQDAVQATFQNNPAQGPQVAQDLQGQLGTAINQRVPIDLEGMRQAADILATQTNLNDYNNASLETQQGILDTIIERYLNIAAAARTVGEATIDNTEAIKDMNSFVANTEEQYAQKTAEATLGNLGGDVKDSELSKIIAESDEAIQALEQVRAKFEEVGAAGNVDLAAPLSSLADVAPSVISNLSQINGLQDAQNLSAGGLIQRLFGLADAYNLNAKGVDLLGKKINGFLKAMATISKLRASLGTYYANVDVSKLIAVYKALNKGVPTVNAFTGFTTGYTGGGAYNGIIAQLQSASNSVNNFSTGVSKLFSPSGGYIGTGSGGTGSSGGGSTPKNRKTGAGYDVSTLDLPEELIGKRSLIDEAIRRARALQKKIPGATAEGKNDIVEILNGTKRVLEVRGVKDDLLRKALEELADIEKKKLEFEMKADTIRRIRVGAGDFSAIANVPTNTKTGVSVGSGNAINVTLNLNGTVLTPAQFDEFANKIAAALKRQIAN